MQDTSLAGRNSILGFLLDLLFRMDLENFVVLGSKGGKFEG